MLFSILKVFEKFIGFSFKSHCQVNFGIINPRFKLLEKFLKETGRFLTKSLTCRKKLTGTKKMIMNKTIKFKL